MVIAVIDSGVANLASVMAALQRLQAEAVVTSNVAEIQKADRVILPGVGAAPAAMAQLKNKNLVNVIRGLTQPLLGICLGMQLLFDHSEEGDVDCLGVIPGTIHRMQSSPTTPIPHMGWNHIMAVKSGHALLRGIQPDAYVYYVHSFAAPVSEYTVASSDYNGAFTAIAAHRNFFGCQFHPERSSAIGHHILQNFLALTP